MLVAIRRCGSLLLLGSLLSTACVPSAVNVSSPSGTAAPILPDAVSPPPPASVPVYPVPAMQPSPELPSTTPEPYPTPADLTTAPASTFPERPPIVTGQLVISLDGGAGPHQVGVRGDALNPVGPSTFRIGGDGTIRILDTFNQRILFFTADGKLDHTLALPTVQNPADFIVNLRGEVFVLDRMDGQTAQVVRFARNGKLLERLSLGALSPDSITLTADQDLLAVASDQVYWTVIRKGTVVAPDILPLTRREGSATPRSPMIFCTIVDAAAARELDIVDPTSDSVLGSIPLHLPVETTHFANIDRAMNLYFRSDWGYPEITVVRVLPDGTLAGGARIEERGCRLSWRQYYIDQAGAVWTLCVTDKGVSVKRYTLQDAHGQPLPAAAPQPADVIWRPGAEIDLASGVG